MTNKNTSIEDFGSEYEYAGFWIRFGAAIIDSIIIVIITSPILIAIYGAEYWESDQIIEGFWDFIISWVLPDIAIIIFWNWKQATPGKMVVKAIIVDENTGNPPSMKQCIIRLLGYYPSILPLGLGCLWAAWDSKKQGWHDKLAGTVVIRPKNKGVNAVNFSGSENT